MFRACRIASAGGFDVFGIPPAAGVETLSVPCRDIGDRTPCADRRPEIGAASRHQKRAVSPAGTARKIDSRGIDICRLFHVRDRVFQVGDHQFGAASVFQPVRSPEIRENEIPVPGNAEVRIVRAWLREVAAPCVECDKKRARLIPFGKICHRGLLCSIKFAWIGNFPNHVTAPCFDGIRMLVSSGISGLLQLLRVSPSFPPGAFSRPRRLSAAPWRGIPDCRASPRTP